MKGGLFILQGGGPTTVINASLGAVIKSAQGQFENIYGLRHSFERVAQSELVDLSNLGSAVEIEKLAKTPGAILGSSRNPVSDETLSDLVDLLERNNASALLSIGGNGTMAVLHRLHGKVQSNGGSLCVCGIPKTVDNDLPHTHVSPGFGSAARFVAMAVRDFGYDFRAMETFDDVTILETMGRDCGWLALASIGLKEHPDDPPHIVLIPECPTDENELLKEIRKQHSKRGTVFIVVSEQVLDKRGKPLGNEAQCGPKDALGRTMWSLSTGVGNYLADLIWKELGLQTRCLRPGNLGRALTDCVSATDRNLAELVGDFAVQQVLNEGGDGQMVTLNSGLKPALVPLRNVAGTRSVPGEYIGKWPDRRTESYQNYIKALIGPVEPVIPPLR